MGFYRSNNLIWFEKKNVPKERKTLVQQTSKNVHIVDVNEDTIIDFPDQQPSPIKTNYNLIAISTYCSIFEKRFQVN